MTFKVDQVASSGKDEFYTPRYAVLPIISYIPEGSVVWCPFDTEDSEFVKVLIENGYEVIHSHIWEGLDFFEYEPDEYDVIISNPPYSMKNEVLTRLYELGKPFAMLLGIVGVFESKVRTDLFRNNPVEVLYLTTRVQYFSSYDNDKTDKSPPFQSAYVCSNILPEKIMFADLDKKQLKTGR